MFQLRHLARKNNAFLSKECPVEKNPEESIRKELINDINKDLGSRS